MRLYKLAGRNQCSQFANILLVLSVMLASFQLLAQSRGKEHPVKYPTPEAADEIAELVRGFVASSGSGFLARQAG